MTSWRLAATEPDEPPDPTALEQLVTELTAVRRRGVAFVDRRRDRQRPLDLPILDSLIDMDDDNPLRHVALTNFLATKLEAYAAHFPEQAAFLCQLFFDEAGNAPGPTGSSGLLRAAQRQRHLSPSAFRRHQHEHFAAFAAFLLIPATVVPRRLHALLLAAAVTLVLLLTAAWTLLH